MDWFYLSLGSIFGLALAELSQQKILNDKNALSPRASLVVTWLIQSIFALVVFLISGEIKDLFKFFEQADLRILALLLTISLFSNYFYFKSFQVKNISISIIFISTSIFVSTTLGLIFFNETSYLTKYIGLFLIFVSIIYLNFNNLLLEKNHLYGLIAGWMFGIMYSIDKNLVNASSPMVYAFWAFLSLSLLNLLASPIKSTKEIITSLKQNKNIYTIVSMSCVGYFIYNYLTYSAYNFGGEVGRIDAINNSYVFLIIIYEYLILKQTSGFFKKFASALMAFAGIVILGFF